MLTGALIGLIVGLIMVIIKRNQEKNAIEKAIGQDVLDTPDFVEFFHYSTDTLFAKGGFKFFDSRGVGVINGSTFVYKPSKGGDLVIDLQEANISLAAKQKRKLKWAELEVGGKKHYFTTFRTNFFKLDKEGMDAFLEKLKEYQP